jgi:hypothetical protein
MQLVRPLHQAAVHCRAALPRLLPSLLLILLACRHPISCSQVWQRPHSQVAIQKLYGRLDTPLEAGTTLTLVVNNRYNTYGFGGDKTGG